VNRGVKIGLPSMNVREVTWQDLSQVGAVFASGGWNAPTRADWENRWEKNPASRYNGLEIPWGWVLECEDRIVGFLGNLPQIFELNGKTLLAAAAVQLVIDPAHRSHFLALILPFLRQPHVDLLLNTTASVAASKIFGFLRFERIPQKDYDVSYYWVTQPSGFLRAALRKKKVPVPVSAAAGIAAAPVMRLVTRWQDRQPWFEEQLHNGSDKLKIDSIDSQAIGAEFDDFWNLKKAEAPKLWATRTSESLRHHFRHNVSRAAPRMICAREGKHLVGYIALVRCDRLKLGLRRYQIADLLVRKDDPNLIRRLLRAAYDESRREGIHMLEIIGYPDKIRSIVREGHPYTLTNEAWPYFYKARDPALHEALKSAEMWYPTLIDGDGF
jgi:hypothetical protein